jgi:hypothetical protein
MKEQLTFKDTPLAEITLRKYEKPKNLKGRNLMKKLCLSIGLLQPGDSRDIVVDIFYVLFKSKKELNVNEIKQSVVSMRKKNNLPLVGIAPSNIRRQIRRLRDLFLVEKVANNYRIAEKASLADIFEEKIEKFYLESIKNRVKEYFSAVK